MTPNSLACLTFLALNLTLQTFTLKQKTSEILPATLENTNRDRNNGRWSVKTDQK